MTQTQQEDAQSQTQQAQSLTTEREEKRTAASHHMSSTQQREEEERATKNTYKRLQKQTSTLTDCMIVVNNNDKGRVEAQAELSRADIEPEPQQTATTTTNETVKIFQDKTNNSQTLTENNLFEETIIEVTEKNFEYALTEKKTGIKKAPAPLRKMIGRDKKNYVLSEYDKPCTVCQQHGHDESFCARKQAETHYTQENKTEREVTEKLVYTTMKRVETSTYRGMSKEEAMKKIKEKGEEMNRATRGHTQHNQETN